MSLALSLTCFVYADGIIIDMFSCGVVCLNLHTNAGIETQEQRWPFADVNETDVHNVIDASYFVLKTSCKVRIYGSTKDAIHKLLHRINSIDLSVPRGIHNVIILTAVSQRVDTIQE